MRKLHKMIKHVKDELCGACEYAEKYIIYKNSKPEWSRLYAEMATDEMEHATTLHKMYDEWINSLSYVKEEDAEAWEHCSARMAEKIAEVRLLLSK